MDNSLGLSRNNTIARISDTMQADYTDRHNVCTPNGVQVHGSDGVHRSDMQLTFIGCRSSPISPTVICLVHHDTVVETMSGNACYNNVKHATETTPRIDDLGC